MFALTRTSNFSLLIGAQWLPMTLIPSYLLPLSDKEVLVSAGNFNAEQPRFQRFKAFGLLKIFTQHNVG